MGIARKLLPLSRIGMATWAWNNRTELGRWGRFAARSTTRLADGERPDVAAEAKLRLGLSRERRTRNAPDLHVQVINGIATLSGRATPEVQEAALRVAGRTPGIRRVRNEMQRVGRRRRMRRAA
ncbi:MAG: BON domain-containing protein [Actinomycetota bacterium]